MQKFTELELEWFRHFEAITDRQVDVLKQKVFHNLLTVDIPGQFDDFATLYYVEGKGPDQIKIGVDSFTPLIGLRLIVSYQDVIRYEIDIDNSGEVNTIRETRNIPVKEIEANCILKEPCRDKNPDFIYWDEDVLKCNGNPVEVHYLGNNLESNNSYDPFTVVSRNDRYALFPEYDFNGMKAFVANKYAWGMNICVGLYDPDKNAIYCSGSNNFDYPVGIALRKVNKDSSMYPECHIFLSNQEKQRRVIYRSSQDQIVFMDNLYNDSNWYNLNIKRDYDHLIQCVKWLKNHGNDQISEFKQKITELREIVAQCDMYLEKRDFENCIATGNRFLSDPCNCLYVARILMCDVPESVRIRYNVACCLSLSGRLDDAMKNLLCIEDQWTNWDHMESDDDLVPLHHRDDFIQLLSRHTTD